LASQFEIIDQIKGGKHGLRPRRRPITRGIIGIDDSRICITNFMILP
jgi:hypothetical protein